jgi:hypothetical protein
MAMDIKRSIIAMGNFGDDHYLPNWKVAEMVPFASLSYTFIISTTNYLYLGYSIFWEMDL